MLFELEAKGSPSSVIIQWLLVSNLGKFCKIVVESGNFVLPLFIAILTTEMKV